MEASQICATSIIMGRNLCDVKEQTDIKQNIYMKFFYPLDFSPLILGTVTVLQMENFAVTVIVSRALTIWNTRKKEARLSK